MAEIPTFQAAGSTPRLRAAHRREGPPRRRRPAGAARPARHGARAPARRGRPADDAARGRARGPQARRPGAYRLPRRATTPTASAGRRSWSAARGTPKPQQRAPRVPEGPALEPARRDVRDGGRSRRARAPDVPPALSRGTALQAPDRIADAGFASLVGRSHLSRWSILASLAAALFWGAAHALSPGHGKTIVTAYLVGSAARRATPRCSA